MTIAKERSLAIGDTTVDLIDLREREADLRVRNGKMRMRDVAEQLGVPEAALLETRLLSAETIRLRTASAEQPFADVFEALPALGEVMALTRNASCVHEKHGAYSAPKFFSAMGQVVGEIDLRLFLQHWLIAYSFEEQVGRGVRRSLQFFDAAGLALHKIYVTDATNLDAFMQLVERFTDDSPQPARFVDPGSMAGDESSATKADCDVDVSGLREAWSELQHSHAFFGLLKEFQVTRQQAMRLVGPPFARPIEKDAFGQALRACSEQSVPVMIFVGNEGCVQIHSGPVSKIVPMGPWLNVMDPRFNLHLREDHIAQAFVVKKPSVHGEVHSIELFDDAGVCFVQMFGERKPGTEELPTWRQVVGGLPSLG
ncbi:MAG: ChuX/HutX family heme-like substrate-binding protein [Pseudomonadota bacterium]